MVEQLNKEFDYYLAHQKELAKKYKGKFIVIKNCGVIGAYDTELDAINETAKTHEMGTFIVQRCDADSACYLNVYHSRVAFT